MEWGPVAIQQGYAIISQCQKHLYFTYLVNLDF